jgi:hypothetical protein
MKAQKQPTFALISPLPANVLADRFLGRIVADIEHPTHEYCPEEPGSILPHSALRTIDSNLISILSAAKTDSALSKLCAILGVPSSEPLSHVGNSSARSVITRSLPQHRECFKKVLEVHRKDINALLSRNTGKAYMAVACKSYIDGIAKKLACDTPAGYAEVEGSGSVLLSTTSRAEVGDDPKEGEHIFAVQYRCVKLKRFSSFAVKAEAVYGDLSHIDFGDGIYGNVDKEDETLFEDDDSDDYFEDDDMVELSNLVTSHDRGFEKIDFIATE